MGLFYFRQARLMARQAGEGLVAGEATGAGDGFIFHNKRAGVVGLEILAGGDTFLNKIFAIVKEVEVKNKK